MYQVSMSTINKIINGKWWKHIYCQLTEKEREQIRFNIKNNQNLNKSSLKSNDIIEIRKLYKITNITQKDLAKKFNVNIKTINEIINRKSWKHI
jgi:DNA-binding XRE family transcriptional regulator